MQNGYELLLLVDFVKVLVMFQGFAEQTAAIHLKKERHDALALLHRALG